MESRRRRPPPRLAVPSASARQADQRRDEMAADQGARLRRLGIRRSDHQHDRGRERNHGQRIMRRDRKPFHGADRNRAAEAGDRPGQPIVRSLREIASPSARRQPRTIRFTSNERGGKFSAAPRSSKGTYFRLVIAVRSAESLTMPVAPHQLEPTPSRVDRGDVGRWRYLVVL